MRGNTSANDYNNEYRKEFLGKWEDVYIRLISIALGILLYLSITVMFKKYSTEDVNIVDMGFAYVMLLQLLPIFGGYFFSKWYLTNRRINKNIEKYHQGIK